MWGKSNMLLFLLLIYLGIYFLIRFGYRDFGLLTYVLYTVVTLIAGVVVMSISDGVVRAVGPNVRHLHATMDALFNEIEHQETRNTTLERIVQATLNNALINQQEVLLRIYRDYRPQLTTEQIVDKLEQIDPPRDGDCGVCYDSLDSGSLLGCPGCHKSAHKKCIEEWISSGQTICIYCRCDFTT